ncbi:hypothetical protein [Sneathiella sp.]|uniref:hypothetical protein n=1 Tax=Sneathiella sp. TaxID=1964365 RepID=UPI002FE03E09
MIKFLEIIWVASEVMLKIAGIIFCTVLLGILVWFMVLLGRDDEDAAVVEKPPKTNFVLSAFTVPVDLEDVRRAVKEFFQACPGASDHWGDVQDASISLIRDADDKAWYAPDPTPGVAYGWTYFFDITLWISFEPAFFPPEASGGSLIYMIGWEGSPGMVANIHDEAGFGTSFCGLPPVETDGEVFVPWNFTPVQELPAPSERP